MAHLEPGMRVMQAPDWRNFNPRGIYWFDMPKEAKVGSMGEPLLPEVAGAVSAYEPYAAEGFVRPALPQMLEKPIAEVVRAFDALDMPFALYIRYDEHCKGADDTVCEVATTIDDATYLFTLTIAMRVRHRGLPNEQRMRPAADKLENRPPDEVAAELKAIGFTNVVVVEKDLPCKRGIVCRVPGQGGWHQTSGSIELWVRPVK